MTKLAYPTYIYLYVFLFFTSQHVFFVLVVCGCCISIPFFTLRLEPSPGTPYWVSSVLSLVFSALSWISFRFWTWRRDPTILKWACPIFALGLALDIIISLPYAIRIDEPSKSKLLRILPLLFGGLSTIYMVIGWLCVVRYAPLAIPSVYQPVANDQNQGDTYDSVPSTDTSAGRCATLFSAQLSSSQAIIGDQNEETQPILSTAHPKSLTLEVGSVTQFSPALLFWARELNSFQALIVALPIMLIWSGVNMAYQISSYSGARDSGSTGGSIWALLFAYPSIGILLPPLLCILIQMRIDLRRHMVGPVTVWRVLGVIYLAMLAMSTAGLILTNSANAPWGMGNRFFGWLIGNGACLVLLLLFGLWWIPDWASWRITYVVFGSMDRAVEGFIAWFSSGEPFSI